MHSGRTVFARSFVLPLLAVLTACGGHKHHGGLPPVANYTVANALAVGDGLQPTPGTFATAYFAPNAVGSPGNAASLAGSGQVAYGPDGSLYRYANGSAGCAISKFAFGAVGNALPTALATGDPNLTGTALPLGCYAAATDSLGYLYVLVANGTYLGVDVFDSGLAYQGQLGNGTASGIFGSGRIPSMPLAIDASGALYVGQGMRIAVFATNDRGDAAPGSVFAVPSAALSLLCDGANDVYVGSASSVSLFPPGGATAPSAILDLPTNALVPSQSLQIAASNSLALDAAGDLYVLTVGGATLGSQVLRYDPGAVGNAAYAASIPVASSAQSIAVAP